MKKAVLILSVFLIGCKPTPEFYKNGKAYYTRHYCSKDHLETTVGYRYGIGLDGKWGYSFGTITETVCDEYKTDTIEIKK